MVDYIKLVETPKAKPTKAELKAAREERKRRREEVGQAAYRAFLASLPPRVESNVVCLEALSPPAGDFMERSSFILEMWKYWCERVEAGDAAAAEILPLFEAWAREELGSLLKS